MFLFMKSKGENFAMIVCHHIRQLVVKEFFPTRYDFPGKRQKLVFFCFTVLPKRIKIKSLLKYDSSVWPSV